MIIRLLWTILLAVWMPVYLFRYQKELLGKRKGLLVTAWCISLLLSLCIAVGEKDMARAAALTGAAYLLAVIAVIDYENKIIPNHLLLYLLAVGMVEYIIWYFTQKDSFLPKILLNLLTGFGLFAVLLLIALLSKGLGGGDVKLLGVLGCVCGYAVTVSVFFWALIVSALVSIALLAGKKKGRKDVLAFGPFIWMGYLISMVMLYRDFWRT